ncbi:MAG: hypothetical protein A2428_16760 [Bdellovibrionales bacterium RIFOXYC1_FULL_54_43]|nr:MAG: hypothetical protein A2428_16760 [Bdellovibrionales bacterium RIFOXYC1_FULL_54_43]OFZ84413.1 MAG: hypothetical protein A2603_03170 [Bdellovibrionales bacterium RIFOXYD1_FULL_55_31]
MKAAAVGAHEFPDFRKVFDRSGQSGQLRDHDEVDLVPSDCGKQSLKFRSVGIFSGSRTVYENRDNVTESAFHVLEVHSCAEPFLLVADRAFRVFGLLFGRYANV